MQNNLPKIIIIILVVTIVIVSVAGTVLYLKTDLFKSKEVLFKKYLAQNVENFSEVFDVSNEEELVEILHNNDYTENLDVQLKYTENEDDEEETYTVKERGVINNSSKASYRKVSASYDEENLLQLELLKQNNIYGFRLTDLVKQFVSVENSNLSYLISSMGYDGKYFSESLNTINLTDLLTFTDDEIEILKTNYMDNIFKDIDKSSFSVTRNSLITLANDSSVTTTAYALTVNRNELDKIYKRILNQAINDEIIIRKLEQIDERVNDAGLIEPEGESITERYVALLQETLDELEYTGEDKSQIIIKVYQSKGETVRTEITTEQNKTTIDIDNFEYGKTITVKTEEYTDEGSNINYYSFSKEVENEIIRKNLSYSINESENFDLQIECVNQEEKLDLNVIANYSNKEISKLNIGANVAFEMGNTKPIPDVFVEESNIPNIVLNNYDGDKIIEILNNLKDRQVKNLEQKQSNINTKMLNNILNWIDTKEKEAEQEQLNNEERKKQRFNNKFELYAGEDLNYEHVQRLLNVVGSNMSDYKVVSGNKIELYIESGTENKEKIEQIANVITDEHTYNVEMEYSQDGYVNSIIISIYKED